MRPKDYELIASCLKAERDDWPKPGALDAEADFAATAREEARRKAWSVARQALNGFELRLMLELELDNPLCDRARFAEASGFDGNRCAVTLSTCEVVTHELADAPETSS